MKRSKAFCLSIAGAETLLTREDILEMVVDEMAEVRKNIERTNSLIGWVSRQNEVTEKQYSYYVKAMRRYMLEHAPKVYALIDKGRVRLPA